MKMSRLFLLELERNNLRSYQISAIISAFFTLGFIYLMAIIPKIEPSDSDAELFKSYTFIIGLTLVVMMGIFSIISATMASKFIVDEYIGKKAILLFSYPICRKDVMECKILLVFLFTIVSMLLSGVCVIGVFLITENIFPICNDNINFELILKTIIHLICYALISGFCGIISSSIGFKKKSVITTIVSSCIIMVIVCQITAMTFFSEVSTILLLIVMGIFAFTAYHIILNQVKKMEL